jgi:signal transduction histidine kinase
MRQSLPGSLNIDDSGRSPLGKLRSSAVAVPAAYAIFGALWIVASDLFLESLHLPTEVSTRIAVAKGWIFVGGSTLLIGYLIRRFWKVIDGMFAALRKQLHETAFARQAADRLAAELERKVEERTAHLEATLRELGHFTDSVSHDLRAPVRSMSGFARVLLEDHSGSLDPEALRILERIDMAAQRMNSMIDGLLDLARWGRSELRIAEIDGPSVDRMLADIWSELSGLEKGREIVARFQPMPSVRCDPRMFENVWRNLLGNAIKYSRGSSPALVEVWSADGWIHVRDNGVGFDSVRFRDVFQPFRRYHSKDEFEGDGIGLALVHRIVERHGGDVAIESAVGRGTTVKFRMEPIPGE